MYDAFLTQLREADIPFTIHEHEIAHTVLEVKEKLSFPEERVLKTIAFRLKTGGWVLVALRGQDRVDYRRLADALNIKRSDIIRLSPEEVYMALGVEVGGVGPIPTNENTQLIFDNRLSPSETVFTGIGRPDRTLEVKLSDLVNTTQGRIAPIAQESE